LSVLKQTSESQLYYRDWPLNGRGLRERSRRAPRQHYGSARTGLSSRFLLRAQPGRVGPEELGVPSLADVDAKLLADLDEVATNGVPKE
jgi:hypothetical protein